MTLIPCFRLAAVLTTALWLAGCATNPTTTLYVAPDGNDAWSGAKSSDPFATLTRARDEIRKRKQAGTLPPGGVAVQLAPGTYAIADAFELQAQDSGTATNPVVYRAAQRGTAVLSGGIPLTEWQAVSDPGLLKRLDPAAQGHVFVATLSEAVLKELPGFASGFGSKKAEYPVALYQNGQRLPVARWPNEGFVKTGECLGNSNTHSHEEHSCTATSSAAAVGASNSEEARTTSSATTSSLPAANPSACTVEGSTASRSRTPRAAGKAAASACC